VRDVIQTTLSAYLDSFQIPYEFRASPLPQYTLHLPSGEVVILCRAMENWTRIIGLNLSFIGCDEIDTTKLQVARLAVDRFYARLRAGKRRQLGLFSTPEGFGLLYNMFVEEQNHPDRALYRGRTADNPHLPSDYLDTLLAEYPANLVAAYTEGEFVNMQAAAVYPEFDRHLNVTDSVVEPKDLIWVGMDFNVDRCWMVSVVEREDELHVVDEFIARDTIAIRDKLREVYLPWIRNKQVIACPDATAKNRTSRDAGMSDVGMLKRAWPDGTRIDVQFQSANPFIRDRVLSVNALILNGLGERKLKVNPKCKGVIRGLEQHAYDLNTQQPQKGDGGPDDLSGQMDALGYVVWRLRGIKPWNTGTTSIEIW
jgi:hypothetical protein